VLQKNETKKKHVIKKLMWKDSLPRQCLLCDWVVGWSKYEEFQITEVKFVLLFLHGLFSEFAHITLVVDVVDTPVF
jgi:hypothetical protein